jgi:ribosome biogenesis GTPase A
MSIQWYPGHMLETKNLLKSAISKVDVILEILDARLPDSSANPYLKEICKNKFVIKVLNKSDLADPELTKKWLRYYNETSQIPALSITCNNVTQVKDVIKTCMNRITTNRARKTKIMVVGIPNTGKSTFLNVLAGKKVAKTGNIPAVTRHQQRTSLENNIDVYDTPGILWPVIEPEQRAYILGASGAISDTAIDYTQLAQFTASYLIKRYPDLLIDRYSFLKVIPDDALDLIEAIGKGRGCLKKGGEINLQKASEILIRELRAGKIGQITFESPEDLDNDLTT